MQATTLVRSLNRRIGRGAVKIGTLVCTVFFVLHLFACLFHYVTLLQVDSPRSWVEASGIVDESSKVDRCAAFALQLWHTLFLSGQMILLPEHL